MEKLLGSLPGGAPGRLLRTVLFTACLSFIAAGVTACESSGAGEGSATKMPFFGNGQYVATELSIDPLRGPTNNPDQNATVDAVIQGGAAAAVTVQPTDAGGE